MKILVTGGAGFVGSHLVDGLVEKGYQVRVLDNLDPQVHGPEGKRPDYLNKQAEFIKADIRDPDALSKAIKGVDIISHQAAAVGVGQSMYKIHHYTQVNDCGTAQLLELLVSLKNNVKKLIIASSMSAYGEGAYLCKNCGKVYPELRPDGQLLARRWEVVCAKCKGLLKPIGTDEEKPLRPTSVYAINKRTQEELCLSVGRAYKIPTVALRYFNIYGPRQALSNPYTGVIAIFASRLLNKHDPMVFEDGLQTRDFVHVKDIVQANLLAIEQSAADYDYFNVGSGEAISILDIAKILITKLKSDNQPVLVGKFRAGDIRHCYSDIGKIKERFRFIPKVKFSEGIVDLVQWVKEQRAEDLVEQAAGELEKRGLTK